MAEHSQFTPLRDSGVGYIDLPHSEAIFVRDASLRELIVRAVNSHSALVDALDVAADILLDAAKALREATGAASNKEAA
jgi:hypothetical protein